MTLGMMPKLLESSPPVVTLSGESVSDFSVSPDTAQARILVNDDGTVDKVEGGTTTQVDAATDWIIPNSAAPGDYEVRWTNLGTGDDTPSATAAEDVWHPLDSGVFHVTLNSGPTVESYSATFDLEIRLGSGPVLASGQYSLSVQTIVI